MGEDLSIKDSSVFMDEDRFWAILDKTIDPKDQLIRVLVEELAKLEAKDIIGFKLRLDYLVCLTYTPELWCAGYIMNGGCSDDGFDYFRTWLVSQGREVYYKAKEDPDSLISVVEPDDEDCFEFELLSYAPGEAFKEKFGQRIWDSLEYMTARQASGLKFNFDIKFNWEEDKPETMKAICPKLYERFF